VTPFFLAFGISARVARLASLVTFGVGLTLLPALARELARGADREGGAHRESASPPLLGWISAALLVTAINWELVCTVMSEALGMTLTLAVLLAEARASRRQRPSGYLLCGLLAAAAFFTKYSYGLPLMAAILLSLLWRGRRDAWAPLVAALAGMAVPIAAWLAWMLLPDPRRAGELSPPSSTATKACTAWPTSLLPRGRGIRPRQARRSRRRAASRRGPGAWPLAKETAGPAVRRRGPAHADPPPNKQVRYFFAVLPVILVLAETELADGCAACGGAECFGPP
jgi:hypothetical protein